jgi:hypothetical protein
MCSRRHSDADDLLRSDIARPWVHPASQCRPGDHILAIRVTAADDTQGRVVGEPVGVGDVLRGSYTFDSRAPNEVDSPFGGQYASLGTLYGFRLGDIKTDAIRIDVFDFPDLDEYNVLPRGCCRLGLCLVLSRCCSLGLVTSSWR